MDLWVDMQGRPGKIMTHDGILRLKYLDNRNTTTLGRYWKMKSSGKAALFLASSGS